MCRKAPAVQKSTPLRSVDPFVFMAATTPIAVPALGSTPKTAEGARQLYDEWAESYDHSLESWRYRLPQRVAEVLKSLGCDASSRILDLGCGTGMSGAALRAAGLGTAAAGVLVGVDISQASLGMAEKRKVYTELVLANLEESLPFPSASFDAVGCVGVLSYVERFDSLFPEVSRVLRTGGVFVASHRVQLWDGNRRGCRSAVDALTQQGAWAVQSIGEPVPYMPGNPDPEESAKTVYLLVFRRAAS